VSEIDFPFPIRSRSILVKSDPETFTRLFQEGEIATGKVIGQIDGRHAILRFKGQNLLVETTLPLAEQEEKCFRIEATSPQVILRLLPEGVGGGSPADWLKKYLSYDVSGEDLVQGLSGLWRTHPETFPPGIRETVDQFLKLLQTFSPGHLFRDAAALEESVIRSGLFLENRLKRWAEGDLQETVPSVLKGDLKALLLKLRSQLNSPSAGAGVQEEVGFDIDRLGKGVDQFIRKLELIQLLNLVQPESPEKVFLLLPFWLGDHPQFLELNISLPHQGSKGGDEESLSILFLLDLPQLGRMNIEVRMKEKNLYCLFKVADPEVSKFMDGFLSDLKTRLSALGFRPSLQLSTEPISQMSSSLVSSSLTGESGEDLKSLLSIIV